METRITTKQFVSRNKIRSSADWADENPNMSDMPAGSSHFKVTLRRAGKQLRVYYSMGPALSGEPTTEEVLSCLAMDAAGVENAAGSFEEWCSEYGYDSDSRKAERIFKVCEKQAEKLKQFLGDDLYKQLLWETEQD